MVVVVLETSELDTFLLLLATAAMMITSSTTPAITHTMGLEYHIVSGVVAVDVLVWVELVCDVVPSWAILL